MDIGANQNESIVNAPSTEARMKKKDGKESVTDHTMPFPFSIALPDGQAYLAMVMDKFVGSKYWNCILDLWKPLGNTNAFSRALSGATFIVELRAIPYPESIKAPNPDLNINVSLGRFRYDRDFLLQFMGVCKEKPDSLPPLGAIGLKPREPDANDPRTGYRRRVGAMGKGNTPTLSSQAPLKLGLGPRLAKGGGFAMGNFQSPGQGMDSQSRFNASSSPRSGMSSVGTAGGGLAPVAHGVTHAGGPREAKLTRSQRGNNRGESAMRGSGFQTPSQQLAGMGLEPVAPLEVSENRWVAGSTRRRPQHIEEHHRVERKVTALLNKLTMDKFDSISDQIIAFANLSEQERDGSTLMQVIKLVFENAKDETAFSEMYARLCRKMMERVSPNVQDETIRGSDGQPIAGGVLFRKYLLNRCQEDFERGWSAKEVALVTAESEAAEAASPTNTEAVLRLDDYHAAAKAKRQGPGLVRFIGELFKLSILTERVMHECIKKLLSNVANPEDEEIECLCKLLTTVGQTLDNPKARNHMDIYFERMDAMVKSNTMKFRTRFLVQDVIELRENRWQPRRAVLQPDEFPQGAYSNSAEANGRNVTRRVRNQPSARGGDLPQLGKRSKPAGFHFGPSSVFAKKGPRSEAGSASATDMFSALGTSKPLEGTTNHRKASLDLAPGGSPNEGSMRPVRKKLNLLPRTKPIETKEALASPELH